MHKQNGNKLTGTENTVVAARREGDQMNEEEEGKDQMFKLPVIQTVTGSKAQHRNTVIIL